MLYATYYAMQMFLSIIKIEVFFCVYDNGHCHFANQDDVHTKL